MVQRSTPQWFSPYPNYGECTQNSALERVSTLARIMVVDAGELRFSLETITPIPVF
jgi:hypothetical protein